MSLALLGIYFVLDTVLYGREGRPQPPHDPNKVEEKLGLDGSINLLFLLGIVLCVLVSGMIDLGEAINIHGVGIDGQNLLRDILLLCLAGLSSAVNSTASPGPPSKKWPSSSWASS